jgi:hypothetical protein
MSLQQVWSLKDFQTMFGEWNGSFITTSTYKTWWTQWYLPWLWFTSSTGKSFCLLQSWWSNCTESTPTLLALTKRWTECTNLLEIQLSSTLRKLLMATQQLEPSAANSFQSTRTTSKSMDSFCPSKWLVQLISGTQSRSPKWVLWQWPSQQLVASLQKVMLIQFS